MLLPLPNADKAAIAILVQKCLDAQGQGVAQWEAEIDDRVAQESWPDVALKHLDRVLPSADAYGNTHYLKQISEFGDRWLRVGVNPTVRGCFKSYLSCIKAL